MAGVQFHRLACSGFVSFLKMNVGRRFVWLPGQVYRVNSHLPHLARRKLWKSLLMGLDSHLTVESLAPVAMPLSREAGFRYKVAKVGGR
jgi:hypothetical protein